MFATSWWLVQGQECNSGGNKLVQKPLPSLRMLLGGRSKVKTGLNFFSADIMHIDNYVSLSRWVALVDSTLDPTPKAVVEDLANQRPRIP